MTYNNENAISSELDRLIDAHEAKLARAATRRRIGRGVFEARREKVEPDAHPLKKRRLRFRGDGLTVKALSRRALVSETTIVDLENGKPGTTLTWERLARALAEDGEETGRVAQIINPRFVPR